MDAAGPSPGGYSARWYEAFSDTIAPEQTERELEFLGRVIPRETFPAVLDLACGQGRHAAGLARRGYRVTGVDVNPAAVAAASSRAPGVTCLLLDMRELGSLPGPFDAVISLWQSFGFFDEETNQQVLERIAGILRPEGRFVIDLYHRTFFERHQGSRPIQRSGAAIIAQHEARDGRLEVTIHYGAGAPPDRFEWQIFTPEALRDAAARAGLDLVLACRDFDERLPPDPESARMQCVFARRT